MSEPADLDKALAREVAHAMDAAWGPGSRPALGWRSVWHSPPGAIFGVAMVLDDESRVGARLWGWDRDLSDEVPQEPVPVPQAASLVRAVDARVRALTPAVVPAAQAPEDPDRPVGPIPDSSPLSTAAALAAREHGYVAAPLLTDAELRGMIEARWSGVPILEVPGPDRELSFRLRPYGSSMVSIGGKLDRGTVGAGPLVGRYHYAPLPPRRLVARADARGARAVIDDLDAWLRQTMPPSWVLRRPVVREYN